ncbi:CRE-SER-2 protein [Caenorhabditis remanei]|uniref:CRE-SER-2 protein n=1 Tax=Caenorhabditis remanei TaxID=31234 RepID=E3MCC9_CAERE|nr:CRE-SER-2 protein [Caenorhabditis remanei]
MMKCTPLFFKFFFLEKDHRRKWKKIEKKIENRLVHLSISCIAFHTKNNRNRGLKRVLAPTPLPLILPFISIFYSTCLIQEMVLRAIDSIRDSVINASSAVSTTTVPPLDIPMTSMKPPSIIPTVELVLGTITYLVIIAMTVVGNTLVVVAVFSYRPLKKVQNYFLVSLAASDLAVAIFVMPLHVVTFLAGGKWLLGVTVCQFFTTADILLCTSSILNLCAIAIDRYCGKQRFIAKHDISRYWAIHNPINYAQKRTTKFVCIVIAVVWALSMLISVPPIIGWNNWEENMMEDSCGLSTEKAFVLFSAVGSFFLPLLVMVVVYVKIFISARQRIRTNRGRSALMRIQNAEGDDDYRKMSIKRASVESARTSSRVGEKTPLVVADGQTTVTTLAAQSTDGGSLPKDETTKHMKYHNNGSCKVKVKESKDVEENPTAVLRKREKISVAKEKRAAKTIAVIIFVFSFCWLPFFVAYVIRPFCETCKLHAKVRKGYSHYSNNICNFQVEQAFTWLGYINSSLNPFLYGILNLEFRRAFKKILCPKAVLEQRRRRMSAQP